MLYADMYTMYQSLAEQLAETAEAGGLDSVCLKNLPISSH
ncbi:MAG: hypothetical protein OJF50_002151 [Nitrospira sp.]|nr:hypothetical protein [Nitrospira sp.]